MFKTKEKPSNDVVEQLLEPIQVAIGKAKVVHKRFEAAGGANGDEEAQIKARIVRLRQEAHQAALNASLTAAEAFRVKTEKLGAADIEENRLANRQLNEAEIIGLEFVSAAKVPIVLLNALIDDLIAKLDHHQQHLPGTPRGKKVRVLRGLTNPYSLEVARMKAREIMKERRAASSLSGLARVERLSVPAQVQDAQNVIRGIEAQLEKQSRFYETSPSLRPLNLRGFLEQYRHWFEGTHTMAGVR